jgi:hypothetical protein
MQLMAFQASHADVAFVAPQLAWDAIWLAILVAGTFTASVPSPSRASLRPSEAETG